MHIGQALDLVSRYDSLRNPLTSLGDYLDPELISRCYLLKQPVYGLFLGALVS
ncbi:TPA: hypothetical protein JZG67_004735 [Escherichia coli]|nr:hypothetical protein [Escherichia coli]HAX5205030.1 hypothetical protein [Escherichia coli]